MMFLRIQTQAHKSRRLTPAANYGFGFDTFAFGHTITTNSNI